MKKLAIALSALTAASLTMTGCGTTTPTSATANCDSSVINEVLPANITSNKTLVSGKTYGLDGKVVVSSSSKLTIPAGTTIAGCTSKSFLLIAPGSTIEANGTQASPIIFTSQTDVKGLSAADKKGEWGGLVLLGNAYTNVGATTYEASTEAFGSAGHANDAESSGFLKYVVVKHTGFEVEAKKELNGLSLGGVGSGTVLENIAIVGGADDGIEIWGGTANITGLYVYNASDDSIDTDLGYKGTITNAYVKQKLVDKTTFDSSGFEFGNDLNSFETDDTNATYPRIKNAYVEVVGGGLYLKNDAGFIFDNIEINKTANSTSTTDNALFTNRTVDTFDSNVTKLEGNTTLVSTTASNLYATKNTKDSNTTHTAAQYYPTNVNKQTFTMDANISNVNMSFTANVWKGKAGSNDPLE